MAELIEALEGCARVLRDVDESHHDARIWAVVAAIERAVDELDGLSGEGDHEPEAAGQGHYAEFA